VDLVELKLIASNVRRRFIPFFSMFLSIHDYWQRFLVAAALLAMCPSQSLAIEVQIFHLDEGAAKHTLKQFAKQARMGILFNPPSVSGIRTNEVVGKFAPRVALECMLEGTPLVFNEDLETGAFAVTQSKNPVEVEMTQDSEVVASGSERKPEKPTMKEKKKTIGSLFKGLLVLASASSSGVYAQEDTDGEAYTLSPFQVHSDEDLGYRKTNSVTATRIGVPISEIPMSISVVSEELIDDLSLDNSNDIFAYSASVTTSSDNLTNALGNNDTGMFLRGFKTSFVYQDGFRRFNSFHIDGIDRAEVVKGPVSLYFGRSDPGGIVNFITKRPLFTNRTVTDLKVGSDSFYKAMVDHQGVSEDNRFGYRVVGSYRNSDSWFDATSWKENYAMGSFTFRPTQQWNINFSGEHFDQSKTGGRVPLIMAQLEYLDAAGALPGSGANTLPFTEIDADNDPDTAPIRLYERQRDYSQRISQEQQRDVLNRTGFWLPQDFDWNRNGEGSFDNNKSTAYTLDTTWEPSDNFDVRLAYNYSDTDSENSWFINQDPHQAPGNNLNGGRKVNPAFATGGDPNCFTCLNYGFFVAPRFSPTGSTAPGRQATINETDTIQLDLAYEFDLGETRQHFVLSAEHISNEGRTFGFITDRDAFVQAGGIPAGVSGFGDDSDLSSESNAILQQKRQQLEDWGLIPAGGRIPNDVFSSLFLDVTDPNVQIPNMSDFLVGRAPQTSRGSDSIDNGAAFKYRGHFLNDRLILAAGVRTTEYKVVNASIDATGNEMRTGDWESFSDETFTLGTVFKANEQYNLYASYNENFFPQPGAVNETVSNSNTGETLGGNALAPEAGSGLEAGIKTDFADGKLNGSLSLFKLEREAIIIQDAAISNRLIAENQGAIDAGDTPPWVDQSGAPIALNNRPNIDSNTGKQEVEGVELEFVYTPSANFQAIFAYNDYFTKEWTQKDPQWINVNRGGFFNGLYFNDGRDAIVDEIENVPDSAFSLWGKYTFTEGAAQGLSLGLGGRWEDSQISEQRTNGDRLVRNESWWRADAMASYSFSQWKYPSTLRLAVTNLFDEEYITGSFGAAPTREWKMVLTTEF